MAPQFDRAALGECAQFLYRDGINPRDLHKSEALRTLAAARLARQGMALALTQEVVEVLAHDYGPEGDIG